MNIETIKWERGNVRLVDQRLLPLRFTYITCRDAVKLHTAIRRLQVRGAPAIGVAGAFGMVLGMKNFYGKDTRKFLARLKRLKRFLASSRPTAVNLFWALDRMERVAANNASKGVNRMKRRMFLEAQSIVLEDKKICRRMAAYGARLVKRGDHILTHCNAGGLATADYGTALGVLFKSKSQGKKIRVYVDETRPLLQGARLTAWELMRRKIETILICDNMAASLMAKGEVDKVFVGADRIASNGDVANKIGTYNLAVLAKEHGIPFYVVAPVSTFDMTLKSGKGIPIEERDADEVRKVCGKKIAPRNVKVYNPAFDVTPNGLISRIITEIGVFKRPYKKTLKKIKRCR